MARSPSEVVRRCCRNHATVSAATTCDGQLWMSAEGYLGLLCGREAGARWRRECEALLWPEPVEWDAASDFTAKAGAENFREGVREMLYGYSILRCRAERERAGILLVWAGWWQESETAVQLGEVGV